MRKIKILSLLFVVSLPTAGVAQTIGHVTGILTDSVSSQIAFANVVLATKNDTLFLKGTISNEEGVFHFDSVPDGNFLLRISAIGYKTTFVNLEKHGDSSLGIIMIERQTLNMNEIVVTANRPLYSVDGEKRIYSVEDDVCMRSASAIDALRNAPGIEVDAQGNVSLRGKIGVEIWINGRKTHMPLESLKQYLKMMPINNIKCIEVITNPSARYGGGASVVNIIQKNHSNYKNYFTFGNSSTSRPSALPWISYVYANEKLCVNSYLDFDYRISKSNYGNQSEMYTPDGVLSRREISSGKREYRLSDLQAYLGIDYSFDTNTLMTAWIELTPFSKEKKQFTKMDSVSEFVYSPGAYSHEELFYNDVNAPNGQFQILFLHNFEKRGHQMTLSVAGSCLQGESNLTRHRTYFYAPSLSFEQIDKLLFSKKSIGIDIDYQYPILDNLMLEFGVSQSSRLDSDKNTWKWFDMTNNRYVADYMRSYNTKYTTRCAEDYLTLLFRWNKFSVKLGARTNYSLLNGLYKDSTQLDFQKHYFSITPSVHVAYAINDENSLTFSLTRRCSVPTAKQVSTYTIYDLESFSKGNNHLNTSTTYSMELSWAKYFKQQSSLELHTYYYGNTDEIGGLSDIVFLDTYGRLVSFVQNINIGNSYTAGAEAVFSFRAGEHLVARLYANGFYNYYKAQYRMEEWYESGMWSYSTRANVMLGVSDNVNLFAVATYRSKSQSLLTEYLPYKGVDIGLSADFMEKRISAALMISDLFNWNKTIEKITNPYFPTTLEEKYNSRFIVVSLVFRLGKLELNNKARQGGS